MEFDTNPKPIPNDFPASWIQVKQDLLGESSIVKDTELVQMYNDALALAMKIISYKKKCSFNAALSEMVKICDARNEFGVKKYGTPLQPFNGRDSVHDSLEEAADLVVYLRTAILEDEMQ